MARRPSLTSWRFVLGAAVALVLVGCGPKHTTGQMFVDPDGDMSTAPGMFFDMPPVDDRLDVSTGDRQDWRYIIVPKAGMLSVALNLDDPTMAGTWYVHDQEGRIIHQQALDPSLGFYELPTRPVMPGRYRHGQIL